jgi:hypothetical protein
MAARRLGQAYLSQGLFDSPLQHRFMQMMLSVFTGPRIQADLQSREQPLPAPCTVGMWILPLQRIRHIDSAEALCHVVLVQLAHLLKWRRLFAVYGILCYCIFDNDTADDKEGSKRRDALRSIGVKDTRHGESITTTDWIIESDFAVFGADLEKALCQPAAKGTLKKRRGERDVDPSHGRLRDQIAVVGGWISTPAA